MRIEAKVFGTLEELEKGLRTLPLTEQTIQDTLEHERDHYAKAVEIGCSPFYGLRIKKDDAGRIIGGDALVLTEGLCGEDLRNVALTPKNPSYQDVNAPGVLR